MFQIVEHIFWFCQTFYCHFNYVANEQNVSLLFAYFFNLLLLKRVQRKRAYKLLFFLYLFIIAKSILNYRKSECQHNMKASLKNCFFVKQSHQNKQQLVAWCFWRKQLRFGMCIWMYWGVTLEFQSFYCDRWVSTHRHRRVVITSDER